MILEKFRLQIKVIKRNYRDKMKTTSGLIDEFDQAHNSPKLHQFAVDDLSYDSAKGICLL